MNDSHFPVIGPFGTAINVAAVHIFRPSTCAVCSGPVDNYGVAIGEPYHAMVHRFCAQYFDYGQGWPHPGPASSYRTAEGSAHSARSSTASGRADSLPTQDVYSSSPQRARAGSFGSQSERRMVGQ